MFEKETDLTLNIDRKSIIQKKSFINPNSKQIYLFISGWYEGTWTSYLLRKRLEKKGESYIIYTSAPFILSSRYAEVSKNMDFVKKAIFEDIKKYKNKKITLICTSLGVIEGTMIAKESKDVKKLILLVPTNSLADLVWEGIRTQNIRKSIEGQGISRAELKKIWHLQEIKNNISNLRDKKMAIYASKQDLFVPYSQTLNLIKDLKRNNITCSVNINKNLGHTLTASRFYNSTKTLDALK